MAILQTLKDWIILQKREKMIRKQKLLTFFLVFKVNDLSMNYRIKEKR